MHPISRLRHSRSATHRNPSSSRVIVRRKAGEDRDKDRENDPSSLDEAVELPDMGCDIPATTDLVSVGR
jgi:hypothetical protein